MECFYSVSWRPCPGSAQPAGVDHPGVRVVKEYGCGERVTDNTGLSGNHLFQRACQYCNEWRQ